MSSERRTRPPQHSNSETSDVREHEGLTEVVRSFIEMMSSGNISRMDLEYGDLRLSLRSRDDAVAFSTAATRSDGATAQPVNTSSAEQTDEMYVITAPMIGIFYVASAPNEPPFVQLGDRVEEGQTIGIIEAMKIMNEIAADRSGTVVEIVANNAQTVEYGSPLVKLALDR